MPRRDRPRLRSHRAPPRHGEAAAQHASVQRGPSRQAGRAQLFWYRRACCDSHRGALGDRSQRTCLARPAHGLLFPDTARAVAMGERSAAAAAGAEMVGLAETRPLDGPSTHITGRYAAPEAARDGARRMVVDSGFKAQPLGWQTGNDPSFAHTFRTRHGMRPAVVCAGLQGPQKASQAARHNRPRKCLKCKTRWRRGRCDIAQIA